MCIGVKLGVMLGFRVMRPICMQLVCTDAVMLVNVLSSGAGQLLCFMGGLERRSMLASSHMQL